MQDDAYINWVPFSERRPYFYSREGAQVRGANIGIPLLVVAGLLWYLAKGVQMPWGFKVRKAAAFTALGGLALSFVVYLAEPKMAAVVWGGRPGYIGRANDEIVMALNSSWQDETNRETATPEAQMAWVRQQLAGKLTNSWMGPGLVTNHFFDQPMREEDSPGNYTLRATDEGIDYVWYDVTGAEHVEPLFRDREQ